MTDHEDDRSSDALLGAVPAARPACENERLVALDETGILDTQPEQIYDDITALAAHVCGTPIALITLVDAERQWFKSRVGLSAAQTPRELAFCAHALLQPEELLEVSDAALDSRFHANPLVTEAPGIRFYAGAPLLSEEGYPLGTLCVIDKQARHLDEHQKASLRTIGRLAAQLLRNRREDLRLREAQERFHTVFAQSRTGFVVAALDGHISECNQRFCAIIGREQEQLIGSDLELLTHPDDRPANIALTRKLVAKGEPFQLEERLLRSDGSAVWVNKWVSRLDNEAGKPLGLIVAFEDLDPLKQLQHRMQEVEKRFIDMAQSAPLKMWITDAEGSCTFINRHWCDYVGETMASQLGMGWTQALHADDAAAASDEFLRACRARLPYRKTYRLRKHDGRYRWHVDTAEPRFDDEGRFLGHIGSVVDVQDERDHADQLERLIVERTAQLNASERRLRRLGDDNPGMILRCKDEPGWPMLYVSRACETLCGYPPSAFAANPLLWHSLMLEEDLPPLNRLLDEQLARGNDVQVEYRIWHRDGSIRWIESVARRVTLDDGSRGFEGVNLDVTARRRAAQSLAEV